MKSFNEFLIEDMNEENMELLYKINYMYDMMRNSQFSGNPTRKENMLKITKKKGYELTDELLSDIHDVFVDWCYAHDLDRDKFAENRLEGLEGEDYEVMLDYVISQYERFSGSNYNIIELYLEKVDKNAPLYDWLVEVAEENIKYLEDNNEDGKNDEQIEYSRSNIKDGDFSELDLHNHYIVSSALDGYIIDFEEFISELMGTYVYDALHDKYPGMVETYTTIDNVVDKIEELLQTTNNLSDRYTWLNYALTISHNTGSMLDYIQGEFPDITEEFLTKLSNTDVTEYNKELRMKGFKINQ